MPKEVKKQANASGEKVPAKKTRTPASKAAPKPRRAAVSADGLNQEIHRFILERNANTRRLSGDEEGLFVGVGGGGVSAATIPALDGRGGVLRRAAEAVRCCHALKSRA